MIRFRLPSAALALMLLAFAGRAPVACADEPVPAAKAAAAPAPISALAWLVDGIWTADATKLGPGMKRIETRYRWSDNGSFIRFTTHFVSEKGELKNYDGNFFWDPGSSTLAIWYMDARNGITQGPVTVQGDTTEIRFRGRDFEGKDADLRVLVTRMNPDLYEWALAEKAGEDWKALAALEYARKPGS